jgi:hypothetical protein
MRVVFTAFLFLMSFSVFAEPLKYDTYKLVKSPKNLQFIVYKVMANNQMGSILHKDGIPAMQLNSFSFSPYLRQAVFYKYGVKGNFQKGTFYDLGSTQVTHLDYEGTSFALFFHNVDKTKRIKIIAEVKKEMSKRKYVKWSLIPSAYAADDDVVACPAPLTGDTSVQNEEVASASFGSHFMGCLSGVGSGVYDGTVGIFEMLWDGIKWLGRTAYNETRMIMANPGERLDKYSDNAVKAYHGVVNFMEIMGMMQVNPGAGMALLNAKYPEVAPAINEFFTQIANLPPVIQTEMICSFVSGLGIDVIIAIVTAGGGSAKIAATIGRVTAKMAKLAKFFKMVGKFSVSTWKKLGISAEQRTAIFRKIMFAEDSKVIEKLNKLSEMGEAYVKLYMRNLKCVD